MVPSEYMSGALFKATNYIMTIDLKFDMKHFLFPIMTDYFLVSCSDPL